MLTVGALKDTIMVDFHVHAFPDEVAPRALYALLGAYGIRTITDGTVGGMLDHMARARLDYVLIQPVATKPSQVKHINDWAASHTAPGIISFGGIHPGYEDALAEVERIISLGLPGIKIQGNWQDIVVDDASMYPIYEAAQGRLMMLFHSGGELAPFDEMKATPKRLAKVHKDFPNLTMIAAHMGGYRMWDEVEEYLLGKNVYLDTATCSIPGDLSDERFLSLIRRHGTDKVLFATDMPFGDPLTDIPRLLNLGLTDTELEAILGGNARRLLPNHIP